MVPFPIITLLTPNPIQRFPFVFFPFVFFLFVIFFLSFFFLSCLFSPVFSLPIFPFFQHRPQASQITMHFTLSASVATVLALLVAQVAAAPVPGSSELGVRANGGKADPKEVKYAEKIAKDALAKARKNPTMTGPCGGLGCAGNSWKRDVQEEVAETPKLGARAKADPKEVKYAEKIAKDALAKARKNPTMTGPCGGLGCVGNSWKRGIQEEVAPAVEETPKLGARAKADPKE
ncbi:hypothetical protein GGTG_09869 [Gaeumannomyces tritici R3-111a-1]|uniref:Uncharacterized protein n=1 Tax=Gaeumannomyces tritici (strain R3-111a-1) TaxID=644352 RepID=J3P8N4_GAET3|nr:hypothetical protein GGTG_09869 [Gaeumannomyces tritici R3-111a-1]EJT73018.1 hypothetical protein GGTG_09869 [Gaeumannomyces tritici R3-111a-1]